MSPPITEDASLYVHIPFCRHRCGYCAFAVTTKGHDDNDVHRKYIDGLGLELNKRMDKHGHHLNMRTLYIGGGTPSRLNPENISHLFKTLNRHLRTPWKEVTFELNPEDLQHEPQLPKLLQDLGVTRISLGTQTTSESGLKILERKTTAQQVLRSVESVRQHFSGSLSLDLIMGWPGQSLDMLRNDDLPFLELTQPDHLSIYMLNYEPGTRLERDRRKGRLQVLDDDTSASLWEELLAYMEHAQYEHYEISNFAKTGHGSLHNTLTWRGQPYLGIGSGAVSRMGKARWTNLSTPDLYLRKLNASQWPAAHGEAVMGQNLWQEMLLLSLRHREGLQLGQLQKALKHDLPSRFHDSVAMGVEMGDLQREGDHLRFTARGWSRFDAWISDWMLLLEQD